CLVLAALHASYLFVSFLILVFLSFFFFFFNDPATTEIYTLSLHDALPISAHLAHLQLDHARRRWRGVAIHDALADGGTGILAHRSEEHTSELQSRGHLVCRLLLEKKKKKHIKEETDHQKEVDRS